jgi:hypothetical protein
MPPISISVDSGKRLEALLIRPGMADIGVATTTISGLLGLLAAAPTKS